MKIGKVYIHKAKTILNRLNERKYDEKYFKRVVQIYECRVLGLCIYRTEHSYQGMYTKIYSEAKRRSSRN